MTDSKKLIELIKLSYGNVAQLTQFIRNHQSVCPYGKHEANCSCKREVLRNAAHLLKELEQY